MEVIGVEIRAGLLTFLTSDGAFNCTCIGSPYAEAVVEYITSLAPKDYLDNLVSEEDLWTR